MVTLSDEEAEALRIALDNYLPELTRDLVRLDRRRDQHDLAALERTLTALRKRLGPQTPTARP